MYNARVLLKSGEIVNITYKTFDISDGFVYFLISSDKGKFERKVISSDLIASIHQTEVTSIE